MSTRPFLFLLTTAFIGCGETPDKQLPIMTVVPEVTVTMSGEEIPVWYVDKDGDGFGDPDAAKIASKSRPSGHVDNSNDCDDNNANVNPTKMEVVNDGIDNNCDGIKDRKCLADNDGDGYGAPISRTPSPSVYCMLGLPEEIDCDDYNPLINTGNCDQSQ